MASPPPLFIHISSSAYFDSKTESDSNPSAQTYLNRR